MSIFVKAAINALQEIPAVNAEIFGDQIIYKDYYDIGIAVGGAQGLVVPVMRDADQEELCRDRIRHFRLWPACARRQTVHGRIDRRNLHDHQWRHLRLNAVHPDPEPAAIGHSGHAILSNARLWWTTRS